MTAVSTSKQPARIAGMFDAIARRYDRLNHLLSAGLDRAWRRRAVRELHLTGRERVLDMCTGTADLAIEAATAAGGAARDVVGVDFAGEMLRLGLVKVRARGLAGRIHLARGDATAMPLPDAAFDAAMVAFGIRNVLDPQGACREFHRVLRPGGRLAVLEFGMPSVPGLRALYRLVLPQRPAANWTAGLEPSGRVFVPAGVGGGVSAAGGVHRVAASGRVRCRPSHPAGARHRVALRGRPGGSHSGRVTGRSGAARVY